MQLYKSRAEPSSRERFRLRKVDTDKRLVFGWANIALTVDGTKVVDYQNATACWSLNSGWRTSCTIRVSARSL